MSKQEVHILHCPSCGSDEIGDARQSKNGLLAGMLLVLATSPFISKKYHCSDCGNVFKTKDIAQIIRK